MSYIFDPFNRLLPKSAKGWEIFLWVILSGLFSGKFWIYISQEGYLNLKHLPDFYTSILSGIITLLIPLIYWLINGQLPIESLRSRVKSKRVLSDNIEPKSISTSSEQSISSQVEISQKKAIDILELFANESTVLANSLYRRSGIYLFIGTLIAVVGVLFFSFQSVSVSGDLEISKVILSLAPRTGILIFIELIAFFFLKQYQAAMDEHRYFELIKRERQRAYAITVLLQEEETKVSIEKYVEACGFNKDHGKLKDGETTEIIEGKKLASNEIKLVENILATIRKSANQ